MPRADHCPRHLAVAAIIAAMLAYPFIARRGIDTADIRVFFLFYFAFAMLLR